MPSPSLSRKTAAPPRAVPSGESQTVVVFADLERPSPTLMTSVGRRARASRDAGCAQVDGPDPEVLDAGHEVGSERTTRPACERLRTVAARVPRLHPEGVTAEREAAVGDRARARANGARRARTGT
jgi:hypothetical protein